MPFADARFPDADPLLTLATVLVAGVFLGLAARSLKLPQATGQVLAGVLIGAAGLDLFDDNSVKALAPLKEFALGLMAVTVGAHLNFRRLRNAGKRLFLLFLFEATVTPAIVFGVILPLPGVDVPLALLLCTLAISTAPATVVAVVKEAGARGVFVKTLIAAVAVNNIVCIFLFEVARVVVKSQLNDAQLTFGESLRGPTLQLLGALGVGAAFGLVVTSTTKRALRHDHIATASILALLFTYGCAAHFGFSPLLACMSLGVMQANLAPAREKVLDYTFASFEPAILAIFFTLAGMRLSFEHVVTAGTIAGLFFVGRISGKVIAAGLAMKLAGATRSVQTYLGLALVPQAGLAIGLTILIESDPDFAQHTDLISLFLAVVLTGLILNEIVGPILTRLGLERAGEVGKARKRLIDFLQEENIVTDLEGESKEQVIERLTDVLISSHHVTNVDRDEFLKTVLDREAQVSTCLGGGLFVPHGIIAEGEGQMLGVMGISRHGLPFPTPDGMPVHCVVLLATPQDERQRHLEVLATLARTIGSDKAFQEELFDSMTPAHAYQLLHGEESEGFNYYLEGEGEGLSDDE